MAKKDRNDKKQHGHGHLSWVAHPLFERPVRGLLVVLLLLALLVLIYYVTASLIWVAFSSLILIVSLRQFFLPTTFCLSDDTVVCHFLWFEKTKQWEQLNNYFIDKNGVLLSPFARPSRLENFRGIYLIGASGKPMVIEFIKKKFDDMRKQ